MTKETDGELIQRQSVITMLQKIENAVEDGDGFQFNEWIDYAKDIPSAEKTDSVLEDIKAEILDETVERVIEIDKVIFIVNKHISRKEE